MKSKEIQAINKLNNIFKDLPTSVISQEINNNVQILVQGLNNLDQEVKQKEQLLIQKEKEFKAFKVSVDNNSKVARDIISESKVNFDQATSLYKSGKFSEVLKYSDIALYNIGDINSFGVKTVEQANKLYVERLELYKESVAKRDYFYNQGVINGVNAFSWVKDNPTRDFYSFFRDTLKVSDKSSENVNLIQNRLYKNLPKYLQEAQRANHFYNEYNKYYDAMTKLQQVVNIHNIRAASSKGLKDYEEALKSCEIALEIDPQNLTLSNLKNAVLKEKQAVEVKKVEEEKLLVSQSKEIEKLKEILARKEVETQEKNKLLTQKGNELASTEKVLIDKHQKETETLKALLARKEIEHQEFLARKELEKQELIVQKEKEKKELLSLKEKQVKELENTKKLQEENIKKEQLLSNQNKFLSDKEQLLVSQSKEIEKLKETLARKEVETQEKNKLLTQKGNELASTEKSLIEKHQKETEALKSLLARKEIEHQEFLARKELEKQELIVQKEKEKKELLTLKEKQAKELENAKRLQEENIKKEQLLSNQNKLLSDKEQRIEELKALIEQSKIEKEELLAKQELAVANKSHMKNQIINQLREEVDLKEDEVVDLRIQNLEKELIAEQKEKLLIQKDEEVRNKSLVKNQIIGGLREAMNEKEKEALYSQIELLKKQLEFKDKEAEDARIISELKDQLLTLKALYGHDVSFAEEFSAIQFRAENSIANNDFGDIADLSRYISRLVEAERDNSVSADFSNLLANISPINHGEEQPIYRSIYIEDRSVQPGESLAERQMESLDLSSMMNQDRQNQVVQTGVSIIAGEQMSVPLNQGNIMNHGAQNQNLIGNFDIDNQHITHSVALGGEGSESFSIIDAENSH